MSEFLKQFVDATGPVSRYSDENYEAKDQPGYITSALENVKGGLENVVSGWANFAGVHLNALDQAGRDSSLVDSIRDSDGGPLKSAGNLLTGIGSYLNDDADQTAQKYGSRQEYGGFWDRATNPSYYTDPRGLTADAAQGVGSMIPLAAAATMAPEIGGARIATGGAALLRGIGLDSVAEKVGSEAAQKALGEASKWAVVNGPSEAISNAGGIYDDLKNQGYSDAQAAQQMRNMAIAELPWDAATEATSGAILSGKLAGSVFGDNAGLAKRAIQNFGINTPVGMTSEYVNEMKQQQIQNEYSNQPYGTFFNPTPDEQAAGGMGAMGALIPGVLGAARGIRNKGNTQEVAADQVIQDTASQDTQSNPNQAPQVSMDDIQSLIDNANAATNNTSQQAQSAPKGYNVTDEVSDTGLATGTEQKLNALSTAFEQKFGEPLNITSMKRHGDGTSWHDSGQAFDAAGGVLESSPEARQWLMDNGSKYGLVGLNEYDNPSENATGGHIHFSDHGGDDKISSTADFSTGNADYDKWINQYASQYGVPSNILYSLIKTESSFDPNAKSDAGAIGLAQFEPETAEAVGIDPTDPKQSIEGAAIYLKQKYDKWGDWYKALEAYNGGDGNVGIGETKAYADKVLSGAGNIGKESPSTNNLTTGDDNLFSNKIIDFADYMRNTSADPETINFFEDKFNNKDKFIDTPENRQAIEQNYSDQFKQYMDQQQDQQSDVVNKDNMDNIINANQPQQIPTPVVPKPNNLPSPVQIETKTPNLDKAKQNQQIPISKWDTATTSQKLNIIADHALQGDAIAQQAMDHIPLKYKDILMQQAQNRIQTNNNGTDTNVSTISQQGKQATKEFEVTPVGINNKTWYHGTGSHNLTADMLDTNSTKIDGLFGHGIYLTDNQKIAEGYANTRSKRTNTPTVYESKVNVGNVLNLEKPMPENAYNIFRDAAESIGKRYDEPTLLKSVEAVRNESGKQIYKEFSNGISEISQDQHIPQSEFVEDFQDLSANLKDAGYDAYTHVGGNVTGKDPHQVLIMLDPNATMSVSDRKGQITKFVPMPKISKGENVNEKITNTKTTVSQDAANQNVDTFLKPSKTATKESEVNQTYTTEESFNKNREQVLASLPDKQLNKIAKALKVKKAGTKSREGFIEKIASHPISDVRAAYNQALGIREDANDQPSQDISKSELIQEQPQQDKVLPQSDYRDEITKQTKDSERFGSEDEAGNDMLKAFGIENPIKPSKQKAFNVIDDSDEALERALKEFTSEINNISANPMFNPRLMTAAFKVGMIHLQRGLNQFADWSKAMTATSPQLKPFLESVWDSINAYPKNIKFDENKMSAVMRYVGTQYDKGITDKEELKNKLVKMIGADYAGLIEPAYAGVVKYPTKEAIQNELNDRTGRMDSRLSEGNNKDKVGQNDAGERASTGGRQSIQPLVKTGDSARSSEPIHGRSTTAGGKAGDSAVQTKESNDSTSSTGSSDLPGSVIDSLEGQSFLNDGRTGRDIESSQNGRNNAATVKSKQQHTPKQKAGILDNIKNDLPMLLPEQADDIVFAEKRLIQNAGPGVLFTNGTGTGKTFTGLGIIKRFVNAGKNNILITTPSSKINSEWIKAGREFFGLKVSELANTKDAGEGVVVTTYANVAANNALVQREWDLIISDESHTLMSSETGKPTAALGNIRAITLNPRSFDERFQRLHEKEYQKIDNMSDEEEKQAASDRLSEQRKISIAEWEQVSDKDKPKVVFLSATPWAHVSNIDYAEGYLFKYQEADKSAYNSGNGKDKFYMSNFGYRMRYNKLTKPDASVNSSVMEIQFHQKLRNEGALSGRALTVDKDYNRGFILVDGGVGKKIDEGFEWLSKKENGMRLLAGYLLENYKGTQRSYLLEAVKAKEAIPLINKYLQSGKKVVVFHGYKKGGATHPFYLSSVPSDLRHEYTTFVRLRPDLVNLDLRGLHSPLVTLQQTYGDTVLTFNGDVSKKNRELAVQQFNDDNSGKNLILVQQDAGQAGISLHDRTGKHQRVLINLGMPTKPVAAIQIEGRIYRVGQQSNAIFRYLNTGTFMEKMAFATKIAERASTAENLALGEQARDLKNSFVDAFEETMDSNEWKKNLPGMKGEDIGGKEKDRSTSEAPTAFDKAKTYYYAQQKKNARTRSAEGKDYFATPEPLGYKMVEWANLKPGDSVLEPSAGHGAIARFFPGYTKNIAIEPSSNLAPRLKMAMDGGEVINTTFENYYVGNKFNAIVMNPPFGTGGKTAVDHVAKAFKQLKDGGRLVAIIPDGPSSNKHLEKWLYGNDDAKNKADRNGEPDAFLMKTINLPGVTFERAGTKINTKVIIIDKQETKAGKETAAQYQSGQYDVKADNINQLFDNIENITVPSYEVKAEEKPVVQDSSTGENSNFETGTHNNTKTGEEQLTATFKDRVSKDSYAAVNSVAKRNGGYYSRFAKGFLFNDETNRENFVKEANALLASNVKSSAQSTIERMRSNIKTLADGDLNGREKALQGIGKKMGVPVVFFEGHPNLHGFFSNGISFLNRKSAIPMSWTFWHESFHWLKANNKGLYNDMVDYIKGKEGFSDSQLDEYRKEIGRNELSNDDTIEEMMADYMPDVRRRVDIIKSLGKENPSLAERFVAWIHDVMDRFQEFMHSPATGLTNAQRTSMTEAFSKLAGAIVDSDGKKLFNVNMRNEEIKRSNGHPLEQFAHGNATYSAREEQQLGQQNNLADKHTEKMAYSTFQDNTKYSVQDNEIAKQDKSYIDSAANKLAMRLGIKKPSTQIKVEEKHRSINEIGSIDKLIGSPSNIAQRVPAFKMFYEWATRGMNKLTKLRSDFNRKYGAAMDLVKTKDDKASLYEILLQGDAESKDWSKQELLDDGVKENVAEAYTRIRRIMNKSYRILNDARRRPQVKSETLSQGKLDQLKENKFVEINKVDGQGDDKFLVTYKEFANWKKNYTVNSDELKRIQKDDAIQILKEENAGLDDDNKPLYDITTREGVADLNKLKGYIPHFFHEFFVMKKDTEGGYSIVDSGKTIKDAVVKAEAFLKENPNAQLVVRPKQFDFSQVGINKNDEIRYAVTVGDREYKRVTQKLAKDNDISITEAREMMQGKLKMKNRHRFYGNFIQRKGASGYEKDLDWVMRHFFNTSSRYVAMETEFKPKAISLFERLYGRFDDEHSNNATARYIKDYINDINGNPTGVELWINDLLNNSKWWRNHVVSNFGDRAALQLASSVTNTISVMKLGCMNISSAMINFSQLINSAALIGDTNVLWKAMQKGTQRKYSKSDLKVLVESGVMNDIGLDSGSGYGKMSVGGLASKSMFFFKHSEGIVRRGTILAAYEQAVKRGMQHDKAIEYAQQVNRKANFDYGVNDAPNIFRRGSIISQIMLQFKKYPIKEFELMAEMLSNQTSKKQKVIFWGSYFLLAGLMQVPAIDWFDDILQSAFGSSYKNKMKQAIFTAAGDNPAMKTLAKAAVYGLFSLANVDVSSRTGVGDAVPKLSKPSDWFGPTSSTIIQTFMYAKDGDTMQALKMLSPGIANMVMAITGKNEGSRGRTNAVYDSMYDRTLRLLGFKSVDESIATDKQSIIYDENKAIQKEKQQAVDSFIENPTSQNASRLKELGVKKKTVDDERKRKTEDKEARIKGSMSKKQQKEQDDLLTF